MTRRPGRRDGCCACWFLEFFNLFRFRDAARALFLLFLTDLSFLPFPSLLESLNAFVGAIVGEGAIFDIFCIIAIIIEKIVMISFHVFVQLKYLATRGVMFLCVYSFLYDRNESFKKDDCDVM